MARWMAATSSPVCLLSTRRGSLPGRRLPWGHSWGSSSELPPSTLSFAVGIYLPLESSAPIFFGGLVRWLVDKYWRARTGQGEPDSGPGVLLSSGYMAGGTIAGVVGAFLQLSDRLPSLLDFEAKSAFLKEHSVGLARVAFLVIAILLFLVGIGKVFPDPLALGERKK